MSIRAAAIMALRLATYRESKPHIIDALLPILSDTNWFFRQEVASVFNQVVISWQPDTINALLLAFSDSSSYVRQSAASAFLPFDPENNVDQRVIDRIRQYLVDSNWDVREQAAKALSYIGEESDGTYIEQLLRQYEPLALRDLRGGYSNLYNALKRIEEKV